MAAEDEDEGKEETSPHCQVGPWCPMVPWCHAQHDQPGIEPASPWVDHWLSSQMPIFSLRSLLFISVHQRSIDPSARLCSAVLQPPLARSSPPRLDHQSRSSIAMFTVFLSHNEICSRHHFSPVTLKVWQNFHTEVSAALQPPSPLSPKLHLCSSRSLAICQLCQSCPSLFLKDSNLDSITFCNLPIATIAKYPARGAA